MHHVIKINATACLYAFSVILNVSPIHVVYCALPDPKLQSRSGSACKSKVTDDFQNSTMDPSVLIAAIHDLVVCF